MVREITHPRPQVISQNLDPVAFDHRVGEQLFAHRLHIRLGLGGVGMGEVKLDHLALTHPGDAFEPQRAERVAHGLALRIKDAGFQHDGNAGFHRGLFGFGVVTIFRRKIGGGVS
jgi:hypothetical protein